MNQHNKPRTMRVASAFALSGALLVVGCTDDKEKADKDDAKTTAQAETAGAEGACDAYADITMALGGEPDGDPATWFADTIAPMADELEANKPADIDGELDTMLAAVRQVVESGDMSHFENPEFGAAQGTAGRYMFDNCDFDQKVEVTGKEYSFDGLPDTMPAGRAAILFTNDGMEAHEIIVASKRDGVTESFDELLAMPEEEAMEKINFKGAAHTPQQGDQGLVLADFEPGEYAALCFIPVGTTMGDDGEQPGDGPPHFMQGMKTEFIVT